jgi:hypothetical protein
MGEMYSDHPPIPPLQAIFECATRFGLTEDEVWRAIDESLYEVGRDATVSEYLEELVGALAGRILAKERHTASKERSSAPEKSAFPPKSPSSQ